MSKRELDTPALCIDLDRMESNMRAVAATCREHGVGWRPHAKGHKSSLIARQELAAGAIGVTCAKLGEAELMAAGGIRDILIANIVVGPQKLERLAALRAIADPIVCVDHPQQARDFSQAFANTADCLRVLVDVDIGLARTGVAPGEAALELAQTVAELPGLDLAGVMGYEGHLLTVPDLAEKRQRIRTDLEKLTATRDLLESRGLPCPIVSCGGTGSYQITVGVPGITEIQAGGAIFMDAHYRHNCQVSGLEYALTVLATVVSRPAPSRAIIDAGRKTMNCEMHMPLVAGREDMRVMQLSAEHGELEIDPSARDLQIGDRLELIPGYADLTCMLHDSYHVFRGQRLEAIWPIEARGRLQ